MKPLPARITRWLFILLASTLLSMLPALPVFANTFTVDSTSDGADANTGNGICATAGGVCTLRAAIQQANASAGADTINFDPLAFIFPQTITLTSDLPTITTNITINGPGRSKLTIDGANTYQPFRMSAGPTVEMRDVTVANGKTNEALDEFYGGCIYNNGGDVTLTYLVIRNCTGSSGGGLANRSNGTITVSMVTFADNSALYGGAIYASSGLAIVGRTTFESNNAAVGGAIGVDGGEVKITNSTFHANSADQDDGALRILQGSVLITNSTFSGNTVSRFGGAIDVYSDGTLTMNNTIVGNSGAGGDCVIMEGSPGISIQHSLFESSSTAKTCGIQNGTNGNITGQDPRLAPIDFNGGSNETHALRFGSPAINAGDNALAVGASGNPLTSDQRGSGFPRIRDTNVDIGAFESESGSLVASLTLQGRANPAPHPSYVVTTHVQIYPDGGGTLLHEGDYTSGANGLLTIPDLIAGTYQFTFKGTHTLSRQVTITLIEGANYAVTPLLLEGDANDSDVITIGDFSVLAGTFGKALGQVGYDGRADFNGDNAVTIADFSLLAANFNKFGEGA